MEAAPLVLLSVLLAGASLLGWQLLARRHERRQLDRRIASRLRRLADPQTLNTRGPQP